MKTNEKRSGVMIRESASENQMGREDVKTGRLERLKKPLIFGLMGIVCAGCLYLIFRPSSDSGRKQEIGLNSIVPQAADNEMQGDKEKAYEQEMLEQKQEQKRNALTTLADYWKQDSVTGNEQPAAEHPVLPGRLESRESNSGLSTYRNAQKELGSFYKDSGGDADMLRREVAELKSELAQRDAAPSVTVDGQLALMEKSYQMAAKYLPSAPAAQQLQRADSSGLANRPSNADAPYFAGAAPQRKTAVSFLRPTAEAGADAEPGVLLNTRSFDTADAKEGEVPVRNSIKACVDQTQTVIDGSAVKVRLLEDAGVAGGTLAKGTVLTATTRMQTGRLQLKISSMVLNGTITAVDINVFDLDGQQGLAVPFSQERTAAGQMAGNMGQQSATSLMLTQSAGQQVAADLSRGVLQGISGYFSKKVKTPKVMLKAGYQLFLVSKKQ